jgi:ankyrin repeat protein
MLPIRRIVFPLLLVLFLHGCGEPPKPTVNLYRAVHIGDLDQIKRHMFWGTEMNRPGPDGSYPIHVAASQGRVAVAAELLQHGADAEARDRDGRTPLHVALANGKIPVAQLLLQHGADDDLQALLQDLVRSDSADRDAVDLLVGRGVDINALGPDGKAPLHLAVTNGYVKLAKRLITAGADVNLPDADGSTPLALAKETTAQRSNGIMADLLEQYGAGQ